MRTAWLRTASKPACLDRTSHYSGEDIYEGNETKGTGRDEDRMTKELSRRNQRRERNSKGRWRTFWRNDY